MQHHRAPRPLPLFLELVREAAVDDPDLARRALAGLRRYEEADRETRRRDAPEISRIGCATLRGLGGDGPPVVLVPSLINPPHILDLDEETSLARVVRSLGYRVFLVDWGSAGQRADLDVAGHVEGLLVPLLQRLDEPAALIGYCLGGTMALAAANLLKVDRVATLACPWNFDRYPALALGSLARLWETGRATAELLGAMPMELLQAAFWSLDPKRVVAKFAQYGAIDPASAEARRFVALEDWANEGEALPLPAARELIEDLFGANSSGRGGWQVAGRAMTDKPDCLRLTLTAADDRIVPAATAPDGLAAAVPSGHVGMLVGARRSTTHRLIADFLVAGRESGG